MANDKGRERPDTPEAIEAMKTELEAEELLFAGELSDKSREALTDLKLESIEDITAAKNLQRICMGLSPAGEGMVEGSFSFNVKSYGDGKGTGGNGDGERGGAQDEA